MQYYYVAVWKGTRWKFLYHGTDMEEAGRRYALELARDVSVVMLRLTPQDGRKDLIEVMDARGAHTNCQTTVQPTEETFSVGVPPPPP